MGNMLKTTVLLAALSGILLAIGNYVGGPQGMVIALIFAGIMNLGAYWFSDKIVLRLYGAEEVSPAQAPELHAIVDSLVQRAGLPKPRVYLIPTETPNAFATGRDPQHAAVAVTQGILRILGRDELEGVLAHELAHVRNRDILISSVVATVAAAISMIGNMIRWAAIFGGVGRSDDEEGGSPIGALAMAIVAPLIAMLIQLWISRTREYGADATGAEISGKPLALASALRKLERGAQMMPMESNPATSHLFIVNPLSGRSLASIFSTHPSTEERVARLEAMAGRFGPRMAPPDRYFA
ncbi:MAG: zinc metalloprotease HtpX [Armatimonadetes bacterium]|nr:zinc metalloprotease HtpX [Armatimonadota bacterium]